MAAPHDFDDGQQRLGTTYNKVNALFFDAIFLNFFFEKRWIVETKELVQIGKWSRQKLEKWCYYESGEGEEEDILQESSCI